MMKFPRSAVLLAAVLSVSALAACESGTPADPGAQVAGSEFAPLLANVPLDRNPSGDDPGLDEFDWGQFWVCKIGVNTTFDATVDPSSQRTAPPNSFPVNDGNCELVAETDQTDLEAPAVDATVVENVPTGFKLDSIVVWTADDQSGTDPKLQYYKEKSFYPGSFEVDNATLMGTVIDNISGVPKIGCLVVFYNSRIPGGGEGCTPGGWKNHYGQVTGNGRSQNTAADWWQYTAYSTGDEFAAVFANGDGAKETAIAGLSLANPVGGTIGSLTLLEALDTNGGGLNALVRHAAAALLNASSSEVDYDLTVAEVQAAFWAAVDGGDIDGTHGTFAGFNEQGCPQ